MRSLFIYSKTLAMRLRVRRVVWAVYCSLLLGEQLQRLYHQYTHLVIMPLNNFQKQSRPVLHWFSKDLQQIPFVIKVQQNLKLL